LTRWIVATLLLVCAPVNAGALEVQTPVVQGALVTGMVEAGVQLAIDGKPLRVDARSGRFVFGVGRDQTKSMRLTANHPDGRTETRELSVAMRAYNIERIDGLPPRKVTPDTRDLDRIRREARLIGAARARDSAGALFTAGFQWPVTGRISGRYGNQRILNGKPRRPHLGVDVAAPRGTPVAASAPGEVVLAEGDLFYTGGTVVIDHGHGVTTIYSHLDGVTVKIGQQVAAGERIGTVGSTGRSTGPHLDWRINWFDVRLDPELIAGPMPANR